ncbi:MAG TPA: EAL domain-containing protein [Micromonosporaceae bacterium]|nr:EAL domain-containing protein [Micromonosporaceae bacterium]
MRATSVGTEVAPARSAGGDFSRILELRDIQPVFQPLIDFETGQTVGYEALARGPAGTRWESPAALFEEAYRTGRVPELDWICRVAAFRAALLAGLHPSMSLFVNSEPITAGTPCPPDLRDVMAAAGRDLRVVLEVTERAVARDPAGLLAAVADARRAGWGIALDDVGAEPGSLAVMPFVAPDVIKLDLGLIQRRTTGEVASIVNAVLAQAERTGATILAEGVETARHARVATAMGATLAQGWYYGRPGPLPGDGLQTSRSLRAPGAVPPVGATPYQIVSAHRSTARATKELLLPMSMHLERKGLDAAEPIVLLACFQQAGNFGAGTQRRFARLASQAAFVGALGTGMAKLPVPGVLGGLLHDDDPIRGEWDVVAIGPHFAGALVALDCGDAGPDRERRFDFAITHDRALVTEAARAMLTRLVPAVADGQPAG